MPENGYLPIEPKEIEVLTRYHYALGSFPVELMKLGIPYLTRYSSSDSDQNESDLFRYFHLASGS